MNGLLIAAATVEMIVGYSICGAIIVVGLIAIGVVKGRTKRQMRPQSIKCVCLKAKKYATEISGIEEKSMLLLALPKIRKLKNLVVNASWRAFQAAEAKKDLFFEGISDSLDATANYLVKASETGYMSKAEYDEAIAHTISTLDAAVEKLDSFISKA